MRYVCLFIAMLAFGCASGTSTPDPSLTATPAAPRNTTPLAVKDVWRGTCWAPTQEAVRARLKLPKTAKFDSAPAYEASYNTVLDVSHFVIYGNVTSSGDYGQVYRQSYYVTWERRGNAGQQEGTWELSDVSIYDERF